MSAFKEYEILFLASEKYDLLAKSLKIIGFNTILVGDDKDVPQILEKVLETEAEKYALIVMPEEYVEGTKTIRQRIRDEGRTLPVFLFLPDIKEPKFLQLKELDEMFKRAMGTSIEHLVGESV